MKKTLLLLSWSLLIIGSLSIYSCKKEDNKTNNNNPTTNTFTPPANMYWKVNSQDFDGSADALNINLDGASVGLSKPFSKLNFGYCNLGLSYYKNTNVANIMDSVKEGEYVKYPISKSTTSFGKDSITVQITVQGDAGGGNSVYYYWATGGYIYVSKKDGKLQYTSDGTLKLIGFKYLENNNFKYNLETSFSLKK